MGIKKSDDFQIYDKMKFINFIHKIDFANLFVTRGISGRTRKSDTSGTILSSIITRVESDGVLESGVQCFVLVSVVVVVSGRVFVV